MTKAKRQLNLVISLTALIKTILSVGVDGPRGVSDDMHPVDMHPYDMRSDDMHPDDMHPDDMRSDDMHPDDMHPDDMRSDGMRPVAQGDREHNIDRQVVAAVCLISLAARGVEPDGLSGSEAARLIEELAGEIFHRNSLIKDSSPFARHLTAWLRTVDWTILSRKRQTLLDQILKAPLIKEPDSINVLTNPLLSGWAYQAVLMEKTGYTSLRESKSTSGLGRLTQWFTPQWIADFLIEQCFPDLEKNGKQSGDTPTFLDASCGAGHILVPALKRMVASIQSPAAPATDAPFISPLVPELVEEVLSNRLFGIDIDPFMTELAGFALYLTCLDLVGPAPLPIPQLYCFENSELSFAGSLLLGIEQGRPGGEFLKRIDGTTFSITALPVQFDCQASNPPYLSHRLMPAEMTGFLRTHYSGCHYDLYAAFLELGIRLMSERGRMAFICQQSFLTTTRYEKLRRELLDRCRIMSVVLMGAGGFASRAGEKVNNAIIALTKHTRGTETALGNPPKEVPHTAVKAIARSAHQGGSSGRLNTKLDGEAHVVSIYNVRSREEKTKAESVGIKSLPGTTLSESTLLAASRAIPGTPIAPLCPIEIWQLFSKLPPLSDEDTGIQLTNGLFTCDNKHFLKHFRQIDDCERDIYVPYDKGGGQRWFSTTPHFLRWVRQGDEIREFRAQRGQARALPGEKFYFKNGITYSYIGTKGFKARLLSPDSIFDIASSALFSTRVDLYYILGFLNSALVRFILGTLNPTINFQIGDLRRIPFFAPPQRIEDEVAELAHQAVQLAKEIDTINPDSPAYQGPLLLRFLDEKQNGGSSPYGRENCAHGNQNGEPKEFQLSKRRNDLSRDDLRASRENVLSFINSINDEESKIQRKIDQKIFDLYSISTPVRKEIEQNEWVTHSLKGLISAPSIAVLERELLSWK